MRTSYYTSGTAVPGLFRATTSTWVPCGTHKITKHKSESQINSNKLLKVAKMDIIDLTHSDDEEVVDVKTAKQAAYNRNTYWCGTFNYGGFNADKSPQPDEEAVHRWWLALQKIASYGIGGWESAPTTGQLHLQFYVQLKPNCPKRLSELKKLPDGVTVHWQSCKGSDSANFDYCSKDGNYMEFGERREADPGLREANRWDRARRLAEIGNFDAIESQLFIQHYSSFRSIARDTQRPPPNLDGPADLQVGLWIYGPSGCGKSRHARTENPGAYLKLANKWWDGYTGQDVVLLEDFDVEHACLGHHLKIWADRYGFPLEVKGSYGVARPKRFIVTSNYHPREIWGDKPGTLEPILRRFELMPMGTQPAVVVPAATLGLGPTGTVILNTFETPEPAKRQKAEPQPDTPEPGLPMVRRCDTPHPTFNPDNA